MIRCLLLALPLALSGPALAQTDAAGQAQEAADDLATAILAMQEATDAKDRVAALTRTIRAYEEGLDALRASLRQATIREAALTLQFEAKRDRVAQLLGILSTLPADPGPLLLLHPTGPLGTARSGMMLAEVTPALQAEAETLGQELAEVQALRTVQTEAAALLTSGLGAVQEARFELSKAIADRTDLPKRLIDDPAALQALVDSAETLDAFAAGLQADPAGPSMDFESAKGTLALPVLGTILRRPGEADAAGVRRPGLLLATRPRALVTAPWPATIRYIGPLLDYGNVMILEPGNGYLLILAGMQTVYGEVGDVIPAGAALGLMGGPEATADEFLVTGAEGGGAGGSETLYLELRLGADPVDPTAWFAGTRE
jgi:septal ring factor EnvC (AmiA/AmiB activator)